MRKIDSYRVRPIETTHAVSLEFEEFECVRYWGQARNQLHMAFTETCRTISDARWHFPSTLIRVAL